MTPTYPNKNNHSNQINVVSAASKTNDGKMERFNIIQAGFDICEICRAVNDFSGPFVVMTLCMLMMQITGGIFLGVR